MNPDVATETSEREIVLDIEGMTCASCVHKVESALCSVEGVDGATVNLATRTATVRGGSHRLDRLIDAVRRTGYGARPHELARDPNGEARYYLRRLVVAVLLTAPVLWLTFVTPDDAWSPWLTWLLATPVLVYSGWPFFRSGLRAARHGTTTMDSLIALGSGAAYAYSLVALLTGRHELYFDTAVVIITLILVGKVLEARARASAGDASRTLLERGAKEATLLVDGEERRISVEDLRPGQIVVVRPGEKIPADGVVKEGSSWIDLSVLTGESVPVDVGPGDEVVGAAINGHGRLVVFVMTVGAGTKLAGMVRLLEQAQGSTAPVQRLADRISAVFVPVVMGVALATFVGWIAFSDAEPGVAMLHAVAVLLIACPCALGLATPVAIMVGTGRAAELGVFVKGGEVFEAARALDAVLLDKTGTVTDGVMSLAETVPIAGLTIERVLALAAAAESGSEHPIAAAVVEGARSRGIEIPPASSHNVLPGAGASAVLGDQVVRVGRPDGLPVSLESEAARLAAAGLTVFSLWVDDAPCGLISVADLLKPDAGEAVARLKESGLEVAMVTGDRRVTAEAIARRVEIERVLAEVFPGGKVEEVRRLQAEGRHVAFVGDGLNDAPALAAADVGIAMGTGTDVALAAADVDVLGGDLSLVADALRLARRTYRVIAQNLFWAFAYNIVMIPLAVVGMLNPMWAAAAMALSSVTVVLNALRLRRFRGSRPHGSGPGQAGRATGHRQRSRERVRT